MYDSRARERRRQIEEQQALTAKLLRQVTVYHYHLFYNVHCFSTFWAPTNLCHAVAGSQRLSEEGQYSPDVEVHVRVPLEKEVPLTPVIVEPKPSEEKPEFPTLTEVWLLYLYCLFCVHLYVYNIYPETFAHIWKFGFISSFLKCRSVVEVGE